MEADKCSRKDEEDKMTLHLELLKVTRKELKEILQDTKAAKDTEQFVLHIEKGIGYFHLYEGT